MSSRSASRRFRAARVRDSSRRRALDVAGVRGAPSSRSCVAPVLLVAPSRVFDFETPWGEEGARQRRNTPPAPAATAARTTARFVWGDIVPPEGSVERAERTRIVWYSSARAKHRTRRRRTPQRQDGRASGERGIFDGGLVGRQQRQDHARQRRARHRHRFVRLALIRGSSSTPRLPCARLRSVQRFPSMVRGRVLAVLVVVALASCGRAKKEGSDSGGAGFAEGGSAGSSPTEGGTGGEDPGSGGSSGTRGGGSGESGAGGSDGGSDGEGGSGGVPAGSGGVDAGSGGVPAGAGGFIAGAGGIPAGSGGLPGGSGGSAGIGGGYEFPPACIRELSAPCPLEGQCTRELTAAGRTRRMCFTSGVTAEYDYTNEGLCMPGDQTTTRVTRDGTLCYTRVTRLGAGCESSTTVWTDGMGQSVASGSSSYPGGDTITCEDGASASCIRTNLTTNCPMEPAPNCEEGPCPEPFN